MSRKMRDGNDLPMLPLFMSSVSLAELQSPPCARVRCHRRFQRGGIALCVVTGREPFGCSRSIHFNHYMPSLLVLLLLVWSIHGRISMFPSRSSPAPQVTLWMRVIASCEWTG